MTAHGTTPIGPMMSMQGGVTGVMSHGQAGEAPSMANCPMMKGLAQEGPGDHPAHYPKGG